MDERKIIQYLDGEIKGEELKAFEDEIRMNPQLAREIERFRKIQEMAGELLAGEEEVEGQPDPTVQTEIESAVRDYKKDPASFADLPPEYRKNMERAEQIHLESRTGTGSLKDVRRIWFRAAALVILLLALSILFFKPFSRPTPQEIFASYSGPFQKTGEIMELARADNDFLFATEVYEAGDYERATALFEMLADSSDLKTWSRFYSACSYLALNQTSRATEIFQSLLEAEQEEVVLASRWQLALCHLKKGEQELAVEQLEILAASAEYRKNARRILRLLK